MAFRDCRHLFLCLVSFAEEQPKPLPTAAVAPETPPTVATDSAKETEENNLRKAVARALPQSAKVRPWDFGKEGVPKKPGNPVYRQCYYPRDSFTILSLLYCYPIFIVMTQDTWVDKKREERKQEFAPPAAYKESETPRPRKFAKHQELIPDADPVISEDSIIAGLAFLKQMQFPSPGAQPALSRKYEENTAVVEENDDDLMPPGETDESQPGEITTSSRWRSMPSRRGAEIAPPPSMDYYNNSSSSNTRRGVYSSQRTDMSQSFSVGMSQRKNVASGSHPPSEEKEASGSKWDFSQ